MRLTTKIYIGVIACLFILSTGIITCLASYYNNDYKPGTKLDSNLLSLNTPTGYNILLLNMHIENNDKLYMYMKRISGCINIKSTSGGQKNNSLSAISDLHPYISHSLSGDTLILNLDYEKLYARYYNNDFGRITGMDFTLYIDSVANVISRVPGINIQMDNITATTVSTNLTRGDFIINDCNITSFTSIAANGGSLKMQNSNIDTLNFDLDQYVWRDKVDNCNINVFNLTGSHDQYSKEERYEIPEKFCKTINWIPKNEETILKLTVKSDPGKCTTFQLPQ